MSKNSAPGEPSKNYVGLNPCRRLDLEDEGNAAQHVGAHEKSNPRMADERLPREIRAEGERRRHELEAKHESVNPGGPSKLRWLRRRHQEPQATHDNGGPSSSDSLSKLRWLRRRHQEPQAPHDNGSSPVPPSCAGSEGGVRSRRPRTTTATPAAPPSCAGSGGGALAERGGGRLTAFPARRSLTPSMGGEGARFPPARE